MIFSDCCCLLFIWRGAVMDYTQFQLYVKPSIFAKILFWPQNVSLPFGEQHQKFPNWKHLRLLLSAYTSKFSLLDSLITISPLKSDHNIVLFFKRRGWQNYLRIKYVGRKINQTSSMGFAASVDNFRSIGVVGQNKDTLKIVGGSKTGL